MKIKNILLTIVFGVFMLSVSSFCMVAPEGDYSHSERRELAKFPTASAENVFSGDFSKDFESYSTDRFPMRDNMRGMKAFFVRNVLLKQDNNGIFYAEGHISKIDATENEAMMDHAAKRFSYIHNTYLQENDVYLSIVPDKNFVLAEPHNYPSLDYDNFIEKMREKLPYMEYIDVTGLLSANDYFYTDTHWKQEKIVDVSHRILSSMGKDAGNVTYQENTLPHPFYGVYSGQFALPVDPDTIKYLTNDEIDNATVTYYASGLPEVGDMYNMEKATGKDPYEMFLSGTMPLVTIEKQGGNFNNHLILFRDSYGSSIAPLLLSGYDKITVVDTRYVASEMLGNLVDFEGADVLFLYSTTLLNNSLAIR